MHVEVDATLPVRIGVAGVDQPLHHGNLVRDVRGSVRFVGRSQGAQIAVGLSKFLLVLVGVRPPGLPFLDRLCQNLVINIGHVTHVSDLVSRTQEPAHGNVKCQGGTHVPDVGAALHCSPTDVNTHLPGRYRFEGSGLTGLGVMKFQSHSASVSKQTKARLI